LVSKSGHSNGCVETENISKFVSRFEIVEARNSGEENSNEICTGEIGWGNGCEAGSEDGIDSCSEEEIEDGWESRIHYEVEEILVGSWNSSVPVILVLESDEEFVDEWVSESGFLSVSSDGSRSCINSDYIRSSDNARDGEFENGGNDVGEVDDVVCSVLGDTTGESRSAINRDEVDEIEDLADVDGERFSSLSNKDFSRSGTARNIDVVDILGGIVVIVGECLVSCIIPWLDKVSGGGSRDCSGLGSRRCNNVQSIEFEEVESGIISGGDLSCSFESDGESESFNLESNSGSVVGQFVVDDELEGHFGFSVSSLINVDLIIMLVAQRKIVGSTICTLSRIPVGNQCHKGFSSSFI